MKQIFCNKKFLRVNALFLFFLLISKSGIAQVENYDEVKFGSFYIGAGYDMQFYSASTIHIQQSGLGNDYKMQGVAATDMGGPNSGFSPMKLDVHLGYYFTYNQTQGIEFSLQPCKYFVSDGQDIKVTGTKNRVPVSSTIGFTQDGGNYFYLNNGIGIVQVNYARRFGIFRQVSHKFALDLLYKAGLGAVLAKADNSLDGNKVSPAVQLNGLNLGLEAGLRWTSHRYFCMDLVYRFGDEMLSNMAVYKGSASLNLISNGIALHIGFILPTTKNNPLFLPGYDHRRKISHVRKPYLIESEY